MSAASAAEKILNKGNKNTCSCCNALWHVHSVSLSVSVSERVCGLESVNQYVYSSVRALGVECYAIQVVFEWMESKSKRNIQIASNTTAIMLANKSKIQSTHQFKWQ